MKALGIDAGRASVLYIEDDAEIAAMTAEVLSEVYRVDHVSDGETALRRALAEHYDLMVVDRRLPRMDGVEFVQAIRTAHITTPVLMLTALGAVHDKVSGLDGGANDYLVKPFDYDELLARLRSLRRAFEAGGARRELGEWTFVPTAQAVFGPSGHRVGLTSTESNLLELLTDSPDHVFTREEILAAVFSPHDSTSSVETYVHYVRKKTTPEIIETVRARGYRAGTGA